MKQNPFDLHPNDLIERLKTCSLVVIGKRPSDKQILQAMMMHLVNHKSPDSLAMVELARTLFNPNRSGLELAYETT